MVVVVVVADVVEVDTELDDVVGSPCVVVVYSVVVVETSVDDVVDCVVVVVTPHLTPGQSFSQQHGLAGLSSSIQVHPALESTFTHEPSPQFHGSRCSLDTGSTHSNLQVTPGQSCSQQHGL